MKKSVFLLSVVMALVSCKSSSIFDIEVSNPSDVTHKNSTIEIAWANIIANNATVNPNNIVVVNADTCEELTHQIVYHGEEKPQLLIFQVTLEPNESIKLSVKKGTPQNEPVFKTFGRLVPERKDDFAWENDRVAFRMYGPALALEANPSNGVDLWLKKTENLIVDKFYHDDLNNGKSYHEDHGEGLDCYKVGPALGCGGIAPFVNDLLWVGKNFITHEVLDNGPLRTTFRLTYDNLPVEDKIFSQTIVISIDAGSQFNKAVVSYDGDFTDIKVAAGIFLHDDDNPEGNIKTDVSAGFNAYGEKAVSDAGIRAGRNYVATVIPDGKMIESLNQQGHILAIAPYKKGDQFTYYFGGGWSQWGFPIDENWFNYVAEFAAKLQNPLKVN